jgi:hypothetical protein
MKKYRVVLSATTKQISSSVAYTPATGFAQVKTLEEASAVCQKYIYAHELGAGNWSGGQVYDENDMLVAQISYNGRINEVHNSLC